MGMNARTGRKLQGLEHIQQSIIDILTTPIGTRIERRSYGSEVPELIDQPQNGVTRLRIYAATAFALKRWERRINLTSVQLLRDADSAVTLALRGTANGQDVNLTAPIKRQGRV